MHNKYISKLIMVFIGERNFMNSNKINRREYLPNTLICVFFFFSCKYIRMN